MKLAALSRLLGVDQEHLYGDGDLFIYTEENRCKLRIEIVQKANNTYVISFFTVWRIYTDAEQKERLRTKSGTIKQRARINVANFKNKDNRERIKERFERLL